MNAQPAYAFDALGMTVSPQTFVFDGKTVNVSAFNFQGCNYVKLDDLCKALNIDAALDWPNLTIFMDKSKPYSGMRSVNGTDEHACCVISGLEKQWSGAYTSTSPTTAEYKGMWIVTPEIEEKVREIQHAGSDNENGGLFNVDGYNYYSVSAFARDNNIDIAYNVDTNSVSLSRTGQWAGDYNDDWGSWIGYGVRCVDDSGRLVALVDSSVTLNGKDYPMPGTLENGVAVAAQYKIHPYAYTYDISEYASSPDFPIREFVMYNSGLQFRFPATAPGADDLKNTLDSVLNAYNTWSAEFVRRQRGVISVMVNGAYADGFLEGGGLLYDGTAYYQYIFAKPYPHNGIKNIKIEVHDKSK